LLVARSAWLLIAAGVLANFFLGLPAYAAQLQTVCTSGPLRCSALSLPTPANVQALQQVGLSLEAYAAVNISWLVAVLLVYLAVGALIFWRKSQGWYGLFVSLLLVPFGGSFTNLNHATNLNQPIFSGPFPLPFQLLLDLTSLAEWLGLPVFLLTFPTGRFAPRWTWGGALLWVAWVGVFFLPTPYDAPEWPGPLFPVGLLLAFGSIAAVLVYRYRRVYTPVQRQQAKWLVFGFATGGLVVGLSGLLGVVVPGLIAPDSLYQLLKGFFPGMLYVSIPLSVGVAILRYRLWDIDTIINQALVYGSLTVLLAALYVGLITGLESLAGLFTGQAASNPPVLVVSTLAIAALFVPVRRRIQAIIDRRFYRKKYDAQKTLDAFSATLRQEVDLEHLREHLIAVVQETMQPAHVSLWLRPPTRLPTEQAQRLEPGEDGQSRPRLD